MNFKANIHTTITNRIVNHREVMFSVHTPHWFHSHSCGMKNFDSQLKCMHVYRSTWSILVRYLTAYLPNLTYLWHLLSISFLLSNLSNSSRMCGHEFAGQIIDERTIEVDLANTFSVEPHLFWSGADLYPCCQDHELLCYLSHSIFCHRKK